jgi:Zn-dependent protease with chaperone function
MRPWLAVVAAGLLTAACTTTAGPASPGPASPGSSAPPPTAARTPTPSTRTVDGATAQRLQRLMVPLLQVMNHPLKPSQVKVGIMDDPHVNAANAGGGEFYVTTGLLEKANDDQLQAVLAHEIAHEDLGHVAKAQRLGLGLNLGMILLDQIIPGSRAITPIAGQLVASRYTRSEEYQADRHGAELLEKIGKSKQQMIDTLSWLMQTEGASGGGFFATHPATGDRIEALRRAR